MFAVSNSRSGTELIEWPEAISYSCIAPLILAFAALGFGFTYLVYKYDLIYSLNSDLDTKGLVYPQALVQLMVGLYLAQVCLIGLFTLQSAFGPMGLMLILLILSIVFHISLNDAFQPLFSGFPRTLTLDEKDLRQATASPPADGHDSAMSHAHGAAADYYNMEEGENDSTTDTQTHETEDTGIETRGMEGVGTFTASVLEIMRSGTIRKVQEKAKASRMPHAFQRLSHWLAPGERSEVTWWTKWLHPQTHDNLHALTNVLRNDLEPFEYQEHWVRHAYSQPEMWMPAPKLWIPRDDARVSRQEVAHTRGIVPIFDGSARLNKKGWVIADLDNSPLREPKILY